MNTKAMEAAIKRLIKYCGKANKEINQSIESRKLIMDIELIYSGLMEMMEQRAAALELADKWNQCAYELRAIFEPKE